MAAAISLNKHEISKTNPSDHIGSAPVVSISGTGGSLLAPSR